MTRNRATTGSAGTIVFVGAGPGDPGMLTARAGAALAQAGLVIVDPDVSAAVQDAVRDQHPGLELTPATGEPAEVAKAAVAAAKSGTAVVRLVAGDPYTSDAAVKEVLAVGRTSVHFDVVPGVAVATAVPAFAGVALGGTAITADLRSGVDLAALAGAVTATGGTLVLQGNAEELPDAAAGLVESGLSGSTPVVVTTQGSGTAQKSVTAKLVAVAEKTAGLDALTGPVVATVGAAVDKRARLSWWESRPLFGWRVLVPRTKDQAGEMSDRLRAYGAVPVEVPTIAVEPPRSPAQMDRAIKGLVTGRYGWIVFTSVNAVKAVREKFAELGLDARAFAGVKVACVGRVHRRRRPRLRHPAGAGAHRAAVQRGPARRLPALRRRLRPDRPGAPAPRRHRDRDARRRAQGARLGDRRRHRLPHRARGPAGRLGPRGHQGRRLRRGLLHLVEHRAQPGRHRRQAARQDRRRGDRPGDGGQRRRSSACASTSSRRRRRSARWSTRSPSSRLRAGLRRKASALVTPALRPRASAPVDARAAAADGADPAVAGGLRAAGVRQAGHRRPGADLARCRASSSTRWTRCGRPPTRRPRPASAG